ncbi:helix-turn-helix domain-containing protein [Amycolatopsis roodepoortensis]|uniref:DNA-binding XRE family transcriptional regulator n=1 Tax=Amycolatopsis roodepoortensis TaxID=700274 RepID=A0ABR9KYT1_9PSEU|nr:helix-turn-helix domain-containing protein [Amycolatopsis roodepoortensis]MBE1573518.1 DNA-binding XRE family transcriptional regulator [Amycolatopsis roodepoortensis]
MTRGVHIGLPGRQAIVLDVLLLNANRVVGIDRLVDAVWATEPPATARTQVRLCVSALRANLDGIGLPSSIVTRPPGYLMRVADAAPALASITPADDRPVHFGELLRRHRQSLGATQRLLAARSTVSVRAIRDLEHGRVSRPRRDTVRLIAAGLGLSGQARADFERAAASSRPTTGTSAPGNHRKRRSV